MAQQASKKTILECSEFSSIHVPVSEFYQANGNSLIVDSNFGTDYYTLNYSKSSVKISALGKVGMIPLGNNIVLKVRPKVSIHSFNKMFQKAGGYYSSIISDATFADGAEFDPDYYRFRLEDILAYELKELLQNGLLKRYEEKEQNSLPRGKINFNKSVQVNFTAGRFDRLIYSDFLFKADTLENRLIKVTLHNLLTNKQELSAANADIFEGVYASLLHVGNNINFSDLSELQARCLNNKFPSFRTYYKRILLACLAYFNFSSLESQINIGNHAFTSFVFDIAYIFEKWVTKTLEDETLKHYDDIEVTDGNFEKTNFLFTDKKNPRVKPDVIIRKNNSVSIVCDQKYKLSPNEADNYQILTHATSLGASTAIIIHLSNQDVPTVISRQGSFGSKQKVELYKIGLNLSQPLETIEQQLIDNVFALLVD